MLRVLRLTAGLGNQIFEYAVYLYFKKKYPNDRLYVFYNKYSFQEHNGFLEVTRFFDAELPSPPCWAEYLWKVHDRLVNVIGRRKWMDQLGPVIQNEHLPLLYAYHNDKRYFPPNRDWLKFRKFPLSEANRKTLLDIEGHDSVFVHVRRGDYLSPCYVDRFKGICTLEYYKEAAAIMKQRHPEARFFVFSDDMEWSRCHLPLSGCEVTYVDWNRGADSYLDLYLMAHCQAGIIANSTFSFWGGRLVKKKDIVYPARWMNTTYGPPDIFEDDWIGIGGVNKSITYKKQEESSCPSLAGT